MVNVSATGVPIFIVATGVTQLRDLANCSALYMYLESDGGAEGLAATADTACAELLTVAGVAAVAGVVGVPVAVV